jgi:hypothetical protein
MAEDMALTHEKYYGKASRVVMSQAKRGKMPAGAAILDYVIRSQSLRLS